MHFLIARADRYSHDTDEENSEGEADLLAGSEFLGADSGCESLDKADIMFRSFSSCSPRYSRVYDEIRLEVQNINNLYC